MKTTVTIEDDVSAQLARAAQAAGVDVNKLVNDLVRQSLVKDAAPAAPPAVPFRQRTHDFGAPLHPSLDQVQHLADSMDDEHRLRQGGLLR